MLFIVACGLVFLAVVCAAGMLEAWARHRRWPEFDDRHEPRWPGRPW